MIRCLFIGNESNASEDVYHVKVVSFIVCLVAKVV